MPSKDQVEQFTFVTSSFKKLAEVRHILGEDFPVELLHSSFDVDEFQGDPDFIVREKCKLSAQKLNGPVLVEDTCVYFEAWQGLPGPYIKWFDVTVRSGGMLRMLADFENKAARAESRLAFTLGPNQPVFTFTGQARGTIVDGGNTEGTWTAIYQPDGFDKTYDQLDLKSKSLTSERRPAVEKFKEFMLSKGYLVEQQ